MSGSSWVDVADGKLFYRTALGRGSPALRSCRCHQDHRRRALHSHRLAFRSACGRCLYFVPLKGRTVRWRRWQPARWGRQVSSFLQVRGQSAGVALVQSALNDRLWRDCNVPRAIKWYGANALSSCRPSRRCPLCGKLSQNRPSALVENLSSSVANNCCD